MLDTLETPSRSAPGWLLPAVLLAFVIGLLPYTADYLLYHPDERHYVDAGIRMLETGDYLTPRTAEGELRLKKPILPYWCVVAGFRVAGISPLGARLGFLLCGAAVVGLAWWGASIAFASRRAANFAAVAAMTQPALLISAPRSVPDVCLALGIQLSVCGFLLIVRSGRATAAGLTAAFAGGAIAILSKGLPAAAFVGYALVFLAWRSPALFLNDWRRWMWSGAIGLSVSLSWFVLMAAVHRDALAEQFTSDQLGPDRFAAHVWQPVVQFSLCVALLAAMSAPWWIAALLARLKQCDLQDDRRSRPVKQWHVLRENNSLLVWIGENVSAQLLVSWAVVYCGLAATINHVTPRYLLPAAAPLSIVIGGLLAECDAARLRRILARANLWWAVIVTTGALLVGLAVRGSRPDVLAGAVVLAAICGAAALWARGWSAPRQALLIAVVAQAVLFTAGVGLSTWRGAGLAGMTRDQPAIFAAEKSPRIVIDGEAAHASQLRVAVGSTARVVNAARVERIEPTDVLVLDAKRAAGCELPGRRLLYVASGYRVPQSSVILRALRDGTLLEVLRHHERRFVVAVPDAELQPVVQQTSATR